MRKLTMLLVVVAAVLWSTAAFAQSYSALDDNGNDVSVGLGGIYISGDDNAGASATDFLPTVSLTGMCEYTVWQAFYGFGSDATAFGGSVDYILADNFDSCSTCETDPWWFGAGASLISYSDLFQDATGANGISDTELGVNVGTGVMWDQWGLNLYLHYLPSSASLAVQGGLTYSFNN